jgi:AcrR family transcriptional regulator
MNMKPKAANPRTLPRRRAFMDAATAVFLEKGYANATLDDVIARSGGSRQTLYNLFGGKQGLFEAIVEERNAEITLPLRAEDLHDQPVDDVLVDVGIRYVQLLTTPEALGVYRVVLAEGVFMKEFAERFWAVGPARGLALFTNYFEQQTRQGNLRLQDPERAARQFHGMLLGNFQIHCALGLRATPAREEIEAYVRAAVSLFLDGCRSNTAPQSPA